MSPWFRRQRPPDPPSPPADDGYATLPPFQADPSETTAAPPASPAPPPPPARSPAPSDTEGRYQFLGELARGGMGAIHKGRDNRLGRSVAVKVLADGTTGSDDGRRRFVREAQIASQLQHPGVAPVYDLGELASGQPYFTMKLVRGQTLAALLAARPSSTDDRPRFLKIFELVCQTLAYAHDQGVLHRDLKPANIMVGSFGEVYVMDWGLAKVVEEGIRPAPDGAVHSLIRTEDGLTGSGEVPRLQTSPGSVLGTPAYMAPEQARGQVDRIDRRSDVFGLGAILCEILTGSPPYGGGGFAEVYTRAIQGELGEAERLLATCGADTELTELTRRCLTPARDERPEHAGVVANALDAHFASVDARLRQAERAALEARTRAAEEGKRRRLRRILIGWVLLTAVAATTGWWWLERQRAERDAALQARQLAEEAETHRLQAARDAQLVAALEEIRLHPPLELDVETNRPDTTAVREAYRKHFAEAGLEVGRSGAAETLRAQPAVVRDALVAALADWSDLPAGPDVAEHDWVAGVLDAVDADPWRMGLRDALTRKDATLLRALARSDEAMRQPTATLLPLARALPNPADGLELLRRAQARTPNDYWINHALAQALRREGPAQAEEALGFLRAALATRPDGAGLWFNLGNALRERLRFEEAAQAHRRAAELRPDYSQAHVGLGLTREAQARHALLGVSSLSAPSSPLVALTSWGGALGQQRTWLGEAEAAYRRAIELNPAQQGPYYRLLRLPLAEEARAPLLLQLREQVKQASTPLRGQIALAEFLEGQGRFQEALAEYVDAAAALTPDAPGPRIVLAQALADYQQWDEVLRLFAGRTVAAPQVRPYVAAAHLERGNFDAYEKLFGRSREAATQAEVKEVAWLRENATRPIDELIKGAKADGIDRRAATAELLRVRKAWAAAARFYAEVYPDKAERGDDNAVRARLRAAACVAQACSSATPASMRLSLADRRSYRPLALVWLRGELEAARFGADTAPRRRLYALLTRPEFEPFRPPQWKGVIPAERPVWERFWKEVGEVLRSGNPG